MTSDERGMTPRDEWEKSSVHKASAYRCGKCGAEFDTPHDFYDHLDREHPKGGKS
jgi:hypothetical protein